MERPQLPNKYKKDKVRALVMASGNMLVNYYGTRFFVKRKTFEYLPWQVTKRTGKPVSNQEYTRLKKERGCEEIFLNERQKELAFKIARNLSNNPLWKIDGESQKRILAHQNKVSEAKKKIERLRKKYGKNFDTDKLPQELRQYVPEHQTTKKVQERKSISKIKQIMIIPAQKPDEETRGFFKKTFSQFKKMVRM